MVRSERYLHEVSRPGDRQDSHALERPGLTRREPGANPRRIQYWPNPQYRPVAFDPRRIANERRKRQLSRALRHPPRKIRKWVQEVGARYDLESGEWYVPVPRRPGEGELKRRQPGEQLPSLGLGVIHPPQRHRPRPPGNPVRPPVDWPITRDEQITEWVRRFIEALEGYERLPIEARDPSDDTVAGHLLLVVVAGKVALRLAARVARTAVIWVVLHSHV
jgi:hypothetical protein